MYWVDNFAAPYVVQKAKQKKKKAAKEEETVALSGKSNSTTDRLKQLFSLTD